MKVEFKESFLKDLKKIKDSEVKKKIRKLIREVEKTSFNMIKGLKKIKGYKDYYRIRIGNYRIGISKEGGTIVFVRVLHRKDLYRYFP